MQVIREEILGEGVEITVLEDGFFDIQINPMEPLTRSDLLSIAEWMVEVANKELGPSND